MFSSRFELCSWYCKAFGDTYCKSQCLWPSVLRVFLSFFWDILIHYRILIFWAIRMPEGPGLLAWREAVQPVRGGNVCVCVCVCVFCRHFVESSFIFSVFSLFSLHFSLLQGDMMYFIRAGRVRLEAWALQCFENLLCRPVIAQHLASSHMHGWPGWYGSPHRSWVAGSRKWWKRARRLETWRCWTRRGKTKKYGDDIMMISDISEAVMSLWHQLWYKAKNDDQKTIN